MSRTENSSGDDLQYQKYQYSTSSETIVDLNTGSYKISYISSQSYQYYKATNCDAPKPFIRINSLGQTSTASGIVQMRVRLGPVTPPERSLSLVNPYAKYVGSGTPLPTVSAADASNSPSAGALTADGRSAVVTVFRSNSTAPVTFALSSRGPTEDSLGSLSAYSRTYLTDTSPPVATTVTIDSHNFREPDGTYVFLALLWGPAEMPVTTAARNAGSFSAVTLEVKATQALASSVATTLTLQPPPLLLVHGVWSSAAQAWPQFQQWLATHYPQRLILPVDYGTQKAADGVGLSNKSFADPGTQQTLLKTIADALKSAATQGIAARRVDVVAHSMGGLVTRYFLDQDHAVSAPYLPSDPVHKLIAIGTPHLGSPLAELLLKHQYDQPYSPGHPLNQICALSLIAPCTLRNVFAKRGRFIDEAVESLQVGLLFAPDRANYRAIVAEAPPTSITESALDFLIGAFVPGRTLDNILDAGDKFLGTGHDTIVPSISQKGLKPVDTAIIRGIVHTAIDEGIADTGETASELFWKQAVFWLMGGSGDAPAVTSIETESAGGAVSAGAPSGPELFDFNGYTETSASNVTLLPATGATFTINAVTNIIATSSTKTLTRVLLFQTVADPTDTPLLYATTAPFSVPFTPTRLGAADFVAVAVFSDKTFATRTLRYLLQPSGTAIFVDLVDAPVASMRTGSSATVHAAAGFSNGMVDVTTVATYAVRSGASSVFSVGAGGTITATGTGVDWLDVSYAGLKSSAQIAVGDCGYGVMPRNQIVPVGGGSITVGITAGSGCSWTASAADGWLSVSSGMGTGNGTAALTAMSNTTGSVRTSTIAVGDQQVLLTQPGVSCTYAASQDQIIVPTTGGTGNVEITTACPVLPSVDAAWVLVFGSGTSVVYSAASNAAPALRTATITVGTQRITLTQLAAITAPAITTQPANQTIATGQTATLSVVATGTGLGYQWYVGSTGTTTSPINGATASTYTTPALTATTSYWVRVSNTVGTANSTTATVTVVAGPTITTQPSNPTIASGGTATLTVVATGTGLSYQWYVGSSGTTTSPISGATSATYTTPALTATTSYWVRVSNTGGSANSTTATITVAAAPTITTQPASPTIASGGTATLTVVATGVGPLTYQWYIGSSGTTTGPIEGATSSSYTTPALNSTTNYWVRVSNLAGTLDSTTATVTVTAIKPSDPYMSIDGPTEGQIVKQPFVTGGWAVDLGAASGVGVDAIHVWAFPIVNGVVGAGRFVDQATLGGGRFDVGAVFGTQFTNAGFNFLMDGLTPGEYIVGVYVHSTVTGAFNANHSGQTKFVRITIQGPTSDPRMSLDGPANDSTVTQPFITGGWAVDLGAPSGVGVDAIHVWAFPTDGSPARFVDQATLGGNRLDVGAVFGSQFNAAGFNFLMVGLSPGVYDIGIYARSTVTGTFNQQRFARVTIAVSGASANTTMAALAPSEPIAPMVDPMVPTGVIEMSVDVPQPGRLPDGQFVVAGWALNREATTDSGIGGIHVWAVRRDLADQAPVFLGVAESGLARPDVGAVFGTLFDHAGWQFQAPALAPGTYDLLIYAWNARTGRVEAVRVVRVVIQ